MGTVHPAGTRDASIRGWRCPLAHKPMVEADLTNGIVQVIVRPGGHGACVGMALTIHPPIDGHVNGL